MRKRALADPPPELLCLPQRVSTAALRTACTQALRRVYRMLKGFQVCLGLTILALIHCMLDVCIFPHWPCIAAELCIGCQCSIHDPKFVTCPTSRESQTC